MRNYDPDPVLLAQNPQPLRAYSNLRPLSYTYSADVWLFGAAVAMQKSIGRLEEALRTEVTPIDYFPAKMFRDQFVATANEVMTWATDHNAKHPVPHRMVGITGKNRSIQAVNLPRCIHQLRSSLHPISVVSRVANSCLVSALDNREDWTDVITWCASACTDGPGGTWIGFTAAHYNPSPDQVRRTDTWLNEWWAEVIARMSVCPARVR